MSPAEFEKLDNDRFRFRATAGKHSTRLNACSGPTGTEALVPPSRDVDSLARSVQVTGATVSQLVDDVASLRLEIARLQKQADAARLLRGELDELKQEHEKAQRRIGRMGGAL